MLRTLLLMTSAGALAAQQGDLQLGSLGDFRLESGEVIRDCRIGYRAYGRLNAAQSNAIVFPTWFSGTSQQLAGNIGRGKIVDSERYYVIAVDAIGDGVSSSPSNSKTQPRLKFPKFSIRDMVESQYRLVTEVLHLKHLHGVLGISMGGMQTFQWMVTHPDFIDRAVPIVGSPKLTPYDLLLWDAELHAIDADANFQGGNYTARPVAAMRTVSDIHNLALSTPAYYVDQNRGKDFAGVLAEAEKATLEGMDTNDWYRQLQAMIGLDVSRQFGGDMARAAISVKAKVTVVAASKDHMVNPLPALEFARLLHAVTVVLSSDCGHLSPGCELPKVNEAVAKALE
jgi:homoserine O-acetyltransferase